MPETADRPSAAKAKKRKQQDDGGDAKKRRKQSRHEVDDSLLDLEAGLNTALARMDPQLLADHVDRQTGRFGTDLSPVELSDLRVPAAAIRDTTSFEKPRTLENLPGFLEQFAGEGEAKRLGEAPAEKGAPHTIIVAGAGLRAADLVRWVAVTVFLLTIS